jgi:hypothetical protein
MDKIIPFSKFLDYFTFYKNKPHQRDGIKQLYNQLVNDQSEALTQNAPWQKTYSTTPPPANSGSVLLTVPYQKQLDNASGQGQRECFSSSCAMLAMYYKKVKNDDEYNRIRAKYGDTTNSDAQVRALKSLGLDVEFRTDGSEKTIEDLILLNRPVPVGWLHYGTPSNPVGGGHWCLISGFNPTGFVFNDPYGEADLVNGGYVNYSKGQGIIYSRKNWLPRWRVRGTGGWYIRVNS